MSAAAVATGLGVVAYGGLALMVVVAISRAARPRDVVERPSCCPHPESEAPETVRGEFRALVIR